MVDETGSTNADLLRVVADPAESALWPHGSSLRARRQTQGRGRAGRKWTTPEGADDALTASVLLRPRVPAERVADVTRLVALAAVRAVNRLGEAGTPPPCRLKWPNDLVIESGECDVAGWGRLRKVGGILVQGAAPTPGAKVPTLVAGLGVNLRQDAGALPVPWATSLKLAGHPAAQDPTAAASSHEGSLAARLWGAVLRELLEDLLPAWEASDGDLAALPGVHSELRAAMTTMGRSVEVSPAGGGEPWCGVATEVDAMGRLLVRDSAGDLRAVAAGDVAHLRLKKCDAGNNAG